MLKTITEKDKLTFIHTKPLIPGTLVVVGILGLGTGISVMGPLTPQNLIVLLVGPISAFLVAYFMMKKKQILIVDGVKEVLEEYIGKKRIAFEFNEIEFADVERVRDEGESEQAKLVEDHENVEEGELENEQEAVERSHSSMRSPELNYHPFLTIKKGNQKYFLFDNRGSGVETYKEAKTIVAAINQFIGLPKVTIENLNLYRIDSSGGAKGLMLLFGGLIVLVLIGYFVLRALGYA